VDYKKPLTVDIQKLALLLTPVFWRRTTFIEFIYCLVDPIKKLNSEFISFREKSIYKIVHNGQVILLEKVLNDAFDKFDRRIYITDSVQNEPLYLHSTQEQRPVYIGEKTLFNFGSFDAANYEFIVIMPVELKPVFLFDLLNFENRIKTSVNYYKLASKRYVIQWI
jgi:hypothetical protein